MWLKLTTTPNIYFLLQVVKNMKLPSKMAAVMNHIYSWLLIHFEFTLRPIFVHKNQGNILKNLRLNIWGVCMYGLSITNQQPIWLFHFQIKNNLFAVWSLYFTALARGKSAESYSQCIKCTAIKKALRIQQLHNMQQINRNRTMNPF